MHLPEVIHGGRSQSPALQRADHDWRLSAAFPDALRQARARAAVRAGRGEAATSLVQVAASSGLPNAGISSAATDMALTITAITAPPFDGGAGPTSGNATMLTPGDDTRGAGNLSRVMRGLQTIVNQRGGSLSLRLYPPAMGAVRIRMSMMDGVVRVTLIAYQSQARALLTQQIHQLRDALETQGLSVDRLQVLGPSAAAEAFVRQDPDEQETDGRSRGKYRPPAREHENNDGDDRGEPSRSAFERELVGADT